MSKVYITLLEAENLIFNKMLEVESSRIESEENEDKQTKAKKNYKIKINFDDQNLFLRSENLRIIVISAVNKFEIPKDDKSIFINHYKVPHGLVETAERQFKDPPNNERTGELPLDGSSSDADGRLNVEHYKHIRRALLHVFYEVLQKKNKPVFCQSILKAMNALVSLDGFERALVLNVIDAKCFPTLNVHTDGFKPDAYFNWAWWGKFTRDHYLDKINISNEATLESRTWMKQFDPTSFKFDDLSSMLASIPVKLKAISAVLVGYYLAFFMKSEAAIERFQDKDIEENNEEWSEITFWTLFFKGLFHESTDYLYATEVVAEQFREIDKRALRFINPSDASVVDRDLADIVLPEWSHDDALKAVYTARTGQDASNIVVINAEKTAEALENLFTSPLYGSNKSKVGIISNGEIKCDAIKNYFFYRGNGFVCEQEKVINQGLIYYGELRNGERPPFIKASEHKPFEALIPNKTNKKKKIYQKKLLLFFYGTAHNDSLLDIYALCVPHHKSIEKIVVVWDVPYHSEYLQTMQFDSEKIKMQEEYRKKFGKQNVVVLAKSRTNSNDTEIIRLLRQNLMGFELKQVEVVDENFNQTYQKWLIKATDHFLIADPNDTNGVLNTL